MKKSIEKTGGYLSKEGYAQLNLHDHISEDEIGKLPKILAIALHLGFYAISIVERQTDDKLPDGYRFDKTEKYLRNTPFNVRKIKLGNKKLSHIYRIGLKDDFLKDNPKWSYLKNREVRFLRGKEYEQNLHLLAFGDIPKTKSESIDEILDSCIKSGCVITLPHAMSETSGGLGYEFAKKVTKQYPKHALSLEINGNAPKRHNEMVKKIAEMMNLPLTAGQDLHLDWGENHEYWYGLLPVTGLNEKFITSEDVLINLKQAMIAHRKGDETAFRVYNFFKSVPLSATILIHILRYFQGEEKVASMTYKKLMDGVYFRNFKRGITGIADKNYIDKKYQELQRIFLQSG